MLWPLMKIKPLPDASRCTHQGTHTLPSTTGSVKAMRYHVSSASDPPPAACPSRFTFAQDESLKSGFCQPNATPVGPPPYWSICAALSSVTIGGGGSTSTLAIPESFSIDIPVLVCP